MKRCYVLLICCYSISLGSCTKSNSRVDPELYFPTVKKIIQNQCLSCHSTTGSWQGRPVALDSDNDIVAKASFIKASVADPVSVTNKRMPLGSTLSNEEIDIIVKWFNKGGKASD